MFTQEQKKQAKLLQKSYMVRKALAETLREKANEIDQTILNTYHFQDEDGYRVLTPELTWTIKNSEMFYDLRRKAFRENGMGHPKDNEGVSIDCVADYKLTEMKHRIWDFVMETLPSNIAKTLKQGQFRQVNGTTCFDKAIDIFLRLEV